jgi:outer membrane protein
MVSYLRRSAVLALAWAVTLAPVTPALAQAASPQAPAPVGQSASQQSTQQGQSEQQQSTQSTVQTGQEVTVTQPGPPPPPPQPKKISDQGPREYSHGKSWFPDVIAPYTQMSVPLPVLTNTPDIDHYIQNGKMMLSLQDAIALALKNYLDIQVQQYNPWLAEAAILKQRAGPGSNSLGTGGNYDPFFAFGAGVETENVPVSNPFIVGTGSTSVSALTEHLFQISNSYAQAFSTGTNIAASWNGFREMTSSSANTFNPEVESTANITITQQLLRGFSKTYNNQLLYIAKNNKVISDYAFKFSVLTDVTNVAIDYWELVYARQNVAVEEEVLKAAEKLLSDDEKQVEIGTMAPLDVTSAQANVAGARQGLIQAQTVVLQDEEVLKSVITKDPLAANVRDAEIVPTDNTYIPEVTENIPLVQAVQEALANRPDYLESITSLKSDDIRMRATHNELLPSLSLTGIYQEQGLAGIQTVAGQPTGTFTADLSEPIVNQNGQVVANEYIGVPVTAPPAERVSGLGTVFSQIFQNKFPTYALSTSLGLPIRNRSAQADSLTAILTQRQDLVKLQQAKVAIVVGVRNAQIALEQDRASLEAAQATVKYQQEAVDAQQKEFQFGTATAYSVVQQQQMLAVDASALVRAEVNLVEAKVQFDSAMGRTFQVNNIAVESARNQSPAIPLIPGTLPSGNLYVSPVAESSAGAPVQLAPAQNPQTVPPHN